MRGFNSPELRLLAAWHDLGWASAMPLAMKGVAGVGSGAGQPRRPAAPRRSEVPRRGLCGALARLAKAWCAPERGRALGLGPTGWAGGRRAGRAAAAGWDRYFLVIQCSTAPHPPKVDGCLYICLILHRSALLFPFVSPLLGVFT